MGEPDLFGPEELRFLRALSVEGVDYLIVGLTAAALQGAPAVTQDIDLWFRDFSDPGIFRALRAVGGAYVAPTASTPPIFAGKAVALFDIVLTMHGLERFEKEAKRKIEVPVGDLILPVLPLDRIIASKKATGRPKDRAILPALKAAAKAAQAMTGKKRKR